MTNKALIFVATFNFFVSISPLFMRGKTAFLLQPSKEVFAQVFIKEGSSQ